MLRTHLCDLLGIEYPIIQAPAGRSTNTELVAAVSNAGGLGSLAIGLRPAEDFQRKLARLPELTARPFAVRGRREEASREAEHRRQELRAARQQGREHEFPTLGQPERRSDREILPAAEIVRRVMTQAEQALAQVSAVRTWCPSTGPTSITASSAWTHSRRSSWQMLQGMARPSLGLIAPGQHHSGTAARTAQLAKGASPVWRGATRGFDRGD